jgi:hypothetical protein
MCPACLTSLAITVATTTGIGAAVTAFVARATRSSTQDREPNPPTRVENHEHVEAHRHP